MHTPETSKDRLRLILGEERLRRLEKSCIVVAGLGGVGSNCAEALARGGVGELVLIDRDRVAASNINRQAVAFHSTLGQPKAQVMKALVEDINPECLTHAHEVFISPESIDELLSPYAARITYIIDAIDTIAAKIALAAWAQGHHIPILSAMGGANKLDPQHFKFARLEDTSVCPLARVMRKRCKKAGITELEVLYSDEAPVELPSIDHETWKTSGSLLGTMSYVPPIVGQLIAGKVIRRIAGLESPAIPHE